MKSIKKFFSDITTVQLLIIFFVGSFLIGGGAAWFIFNSYLSGLESGKLLEATIPVSEKSSRSREAKFTIQVYPDIVPRVADIYKSKKNISPTNFIDQLYTAEELLGRGAVLTADGWIVTSAGGVGGHPAEELAVLVDSQIYFPRLLAADSVSGTVYLKIEASNLSVNKFGDSSRMLAGETIFVARNGQLTIDYLEDVNFFREIGGDDLVRSSEKMYNSFLLQNPLAADFIGAPVFNATGEIIGIIAAGEGENRQLIIPLGNFSKSIDGFLKGEKLNRPYLGVKFIDIAAARGVSKKDEFFDIRGIKLNSLGGAFLYNFPSLRDAVTFGSPADKAGLQPKDLIMKVEDTPINGLNNFTSLIQEYAPGEKIKLTILREGNKEVVIEVELGSLTE
ncbi:MAG: PDZ domain-containing protein [Patescibacteria group bacterium]|nr:PDZ domain-containing protein [Patescibacteria group bacterium]MDD5043924.1 PDZ domain-containing protein [Patescibacteria group bacterium]MDD5490757.1 PDZ domain-containing protein [Patescibacteria group bacterium]